MTGIIKTTAYVLGNFLRRTVRMDGLLLTRAMCTALPLGQNYYDGGNPVSGLNTVIHRSFRSSPASCAPPPKKSSGAFKAGMTGAKKKFDVDTDPHKLVNNLCGGQYLKEGPDIKLKPDSEYPDWLWTLRTAAPPTLKEMDPTTIEYWREVVTLKQRERYKMLKSVRGRFWDLRMAKRGAARRHYERQLNVWQATGEVIPRKGFNYEPIIAKLRENS